ncbi:glycosyltransferase family 39 protein, partial [bacterium]|nr:glycosyltransferase family 39 protein [bacterium]
MEKIKKIITSNTFLVPFILLFMFFVMITSSIGDSATNDEVPHIVSGYSYIKTGDYRLNPEHPPLIKDMAGLPLLFLNPQPKLPSDHFSRQINDQWAEGDAFLFKTGNNPDLILFWARLPIILLSLIGGYFVYRWAKELYGKKAGLFALFLYAFDANIIAHSRFVTTDLGVALTIFINLYFLWKFVTEPSKKRLLWVALTLAIALLTKFSAPILVVSYVLLGIYLSIMPKKYDKGSLLFTRFFNAGFLRRFFGYFFSFFSAGFLAFIIVWIFYFIQTINMPADIFTKSVQAGLGDDSPAKQILLSFSYNEFLRPIGHYMLGFFMVTQHAIGGHTSFLLGQLSNGWWYYYIIAFLVKTPIPAIVFIFSSFVFWKPKKD